jgi:hypothetical protein
MSPGEFAGSNHGKKNTEAPENRDVGIWFPGNGCPERGSVIVGKPLKLPCNIAGDTVGELNTCA